MPPVGVSRRNAGMGWSRLACIVCSRTVSRRAVVPRFREGMPTRAGATEPPGHLGAGERSQATAHFTKQAGGDTTDIRPFPVPSFSRRGEGTEVAGAKPEARRTSGVSNAIRIQVHRSGLEHQNRPRNG